MAQGNGRRGSTLRPGRNGAQRRRRKPNGLRLLRVAFLSALFVGTAFVFAALFTVVVAFQTGNAAYAAFSDDLPPVESINDHNTYKTIHIYDRHGTLLWEFWEPTAGMRTPLPLGEISQHLIDATLSAEDSSFYTNPGFDARSILRAAMQNFSRQDVVSGASTITQQLVRNVMLSPEERYDQTITRKLREALLAYRLTQELSKDRILELYLNEISYGNMAFGVEAASLTYFNKHARDLTLAEAALIAGLPQAPSLYNPYRNPEAALARRTYVLEQMARHGFISPPEAEVAKREPLELSPYQVDMQAPHWVSYIREELEERYGPEVVYRSGLKVFTTLDLGLQHELEQVARSNLETLHLHEATNTAITAINPKTGEILAMMGSVDYWNNEIDGQVNVLTTVSGRQPGSAIKPLVYMTAFTRGWNPATVVQDTPSCWRDQAGNNWCPQNFDNAFRGPVTVRAALGNSLNIPAVKALEFTGIEPVREVARNTGITTWDDRYLGLSATLGGAEVKPLELTAFYGILANNGRRIPPVAITKITDAQNNVLLDYQVPAGEQIVDPRAAYMVTHILADNSARLATFGPNSLINLPRPAGVKTGTTDNYRDTWTVGYTPNLVVGVWVGNADGRPMQRVLSSMSAGKVWREAMDASLAYLDLPPEDFQRPEGLVEREVCGSTRLRPGAPACYNEIFMAERAPRLERLYVEGAAPTPAPTPTPDESPTPSAEQTPEAVVPGDEPAGPTATPQPATQPQAGQVEVPLVRGMRAEDATAQLSGMGFQVRTQEATSSWPRGVVMNQSPSEGQTVPRGTAITLTVSSGD